MTSVVYIRQQLYYQNPIWMKEQAEAYQKGKISDLWAKRMVSTNSTISR